MFGHWAAVGRDGLVSTACGSGRVTLEGGLSELEDVWSQALAEAEARARASGRKDISEYLALRNTNDRIRRIAGDWLFTAFLTVVDEANLEAAGIHISRDDDHHFKLGPATMTGKRLILRKGERALTVELGWPRTPRDGFIRGGGLAGANIKHRGIKSANEHLRLVVGPEGAPHWVGQKGCESQEQFHEANIRTHVSILLDESRTEHKHS